MQLEVNFPVTGEKKATKEALMVCSKRQLRDDEDLQEGMGDLVIFLWFEECIVLC